MHTIFNARKGTLIMPDLFDQASELEQKYRDEALSAPPAEVTPHVGCEECDANGEGIGKACQYYSDCLADWVKRDTAKKRNGYA